MGFRSFVIKPVARKIARGINQWSRQAVKAQRKVFGELVEVGRRTAFGKEHDFKNIHSYEDFRQRVPIRDYESLRPYIDRIKAGEADVLWNGFPQYFAKT